MRGSLILLLALAGCAAQSPSYRPLDPEDEMKLALQELAARQAELRGVASVQDCGRTCELAGLVCEAAQRVCAIASRHPERADFAPRCAGATSACDEARSSCEGCKQDAARP